MGSLGTALLIAFVTGILEWDLYGGFQTQISRPIIVGPIIGLILNDFQTGLYIGASLEMVYLGVIAVGAAVPPDATLATAITTSLAILSGMDKDAAITLAVPVAVAAQMLQMLIWTLNSGLMHRADKFIEDGQVKKAANLQYVGMLMFFLQGFVPAFLAVLLGANVVGNLVNAMPAWVENWLSMAGGMLPALGFAMLYKLMIDKTLIPYFIIGFVVATAFGGTLVSTALLGVALALIYLNSIKEDKDTNKKSRRESA